MRYVLKVPYFTGEGLEDNFLASTALCLSTRVFCRSEYLQVDDLQVSDHWTTDLLLRIIPCLSRPHPT